YAHKLCAGCAFVAAIWFSKHRPLQIALAVLVPVSFALSHIEAFRALYVALLMYLFFVCGLALIRWHFEYVASVVLGIAVVSLPVMVMQLTGWPSWINGLATHGYNGDPLGPTLFLSFAELKVTYWQTRPAGVFSSNQANTIFFFVLLSIAVTRPGRLN